MRLERLWAVWGHKDECVTRLFESPLSVSLTGQTCTPQNTWREGGQSMQGKCRESNRKLFVRIVCDKRGSFHVLDKSPNIQIMVLAAHTQVKLDTSLVYGFGKWTCSLRLMELWIMSDTVQRNYKNIKDWIKFLIRFKCMRRFGRACAYVWFGTLRG